jgi:hypothetical protein
MSEQAEQVPISTVATAWPANGELIVKYILNGWPAGTFEGFTLMSIGPDAATRVTLIVAERLKYEARTKTRLSIVARAFARFKAVSTLPQNVIGQGICLLNQRRFVNLVLLLDFDLGGWSTRMPPNGPHAKPNDGGAASF